MELTTLLNPGHNDSEAELRELSTWVAGEIGPDVPLHFSAFHPDHKMLDVERTPLATLRRARDIAMEVGLNFVYCGNVHDIDSDTTRCAGCGERLIVRDWYRMVEYRVTESGTCPSCGLTLPGRFGTRL